MGTSIEWPSREDWAYKRRHFSDGLSPKEVLDDLRTYATPEEVAAVIADLKAAWRQLGQAMKEVKVKAGARLDPLLRQRGEPHRDYSRRWGQMTPEELALLASYMDPQTMRGRVSKLIRDLESSGFIHGWRTLPGVERLGPIVARQEAAIAEANADLAHRVATRPIDDAAWAKELEWRAWIERTRGMGRIREAEERTP